MTTALEGGEWSAARPGRTLPPGKTRYPLFRKLGGPQGRSGRAENLAPPGFNPRTVQPVVSRYTDWATRPTNDKIYLYVCKNTIPHNSVHGQPVTSKAKIRSQTNPYVTGWGNGGIGSGSALQYFGFPLSVSLHQRYILLHSSITDFA